MFRRGVAAAFRAAQRARAGALVASSVRAHSSKAAAVLGGSSSWATTGALTFMAGAAALAYAPEAHASSNSERTYIMLKPDGVHRGLLHEVIKRFEQKGYKLVGIKVLVPTADLAAKHYAEHDGKPFFPKLVNFLSSGAVVAMVWEGKEVIKYGRTMIGATNPLASAPGTLRGDFAVDVGRNIIHGSDSLESAQREIALWFRPEELATYTPVATPWIYE